MRKSQYLFCWVCAATLAAAALPLVAADSKSPVAHLKAGDAAPLFAGRDQDCKKWKLASHVGKKVVLLCFYPEDNTTGSIAETCGLCDNMFEIKQAGVEVVGVSFDDKKTQKEFVFKYNLDFPLLADTSGHIADAYGARMGPDRNMDRRISFLIGLDGKILHVTDSPDATVQIKELAEALAKLKEVVSR
jgi:thioredoxin-dependent peroxiredoxin